jgi:chemotaxis response regulator CheB
VLGKPEDTDSWRQLADTLPEMVRTAAAARAKMDELAEPPPAPQARRLEQLTVAPRTLRWVAVGASTGGPTAFRELLAALPDSFPATLLLVQHITSGFEAGLADWLNKEFVPDVRLARDGEQPPPGCVRLAPGEAHLVLEPGGVLSLDRKSPQRSGHRPSVDALFSSVARAAPESSAGVLLTGMGADGVEGLLDLRRAGCLTLAQDEASSIVWGMPRVAVEQGAAEVVLPPGDIGRYLVRTWRGRRRGGTSR